MSEERLNRIEQKIDKLSEAITMIARVEEKLSANNARVDRLEFRADEQEADTDRLKQIVGYNSQTAKTAERFAWIVVTALVGIVSFQFKG